MADSQHKCVLVIITTLALSPLSCLAAEYADFIRDGEAAYGNGNLAEAEKQFNLALKAAESSGPSNLKVAEALQDLGVIYDEKKRYAEAETAYKRALTIREKEYGPSHMAVATTLNNLGNLYKDEKKYKEAEALYKRSIDICLAKEGSNSEYLGMSYYNLATLQVAQDKDEDAIPLLKRALQISEKSSANREHIMDIVGKLGTACEKTGKIPEAKAQFVRYFEMAAAVLELNPTDPKTMTILKDFAAHERKNNDIGVAELTEKAIKYRSEPSH